MLVDAPVVKASSPAPPHPMVSFIERRPDVVLPVWIIAYFAVLWRAAHRPLWYDELFSYYVSMSPTWERFIGSVRNVDLNPPLSYLFVRSSVALFGDTPFAVRLPCMLGFLAASLIVYRLITKRLGAGFGLAALGIFWSSSLTQFAVEARPYGLLLAFFTIGMLCWLNAAEADRWTLWHAGLAIAIAAMFLTHCFSLPFAAAIGAGELARAIVSRRIDRRVWTMLIVPLSVLPIYVPLARNAGAILFPPEFAATLAGIPKFYLVALFPLLPAMITILLFWLPGRRSGRPVPWGELAQPHEIVFSIAAVLAPTVTISYSIWNHSPFWPRYGIGIVLGVTLILTALLAVAIRRNPGVSRVAAVNILILFCVTKAGTGHLAEEYENPSTAYRTIRPDLPFVTASALTFLDMDHREVPALVSRLYYLTDPESALRYHSTIFEGMPTVKKWFPVQANVAAYRDFTSRNRQFLVLGTRSYPEDWLLWKLQEDGAQIRLLDDRKTGYHDRELYEVTLRP